MKCCRGFVKRFCFAAIVSALLSAGLFSGLFSVNLLAAEPVPAPLDPAIASRLASLIGQLGDKEYEVREKAANEIAEIGLVARPALLEARSSPSIEVRLRTERLLTEIHTRDFDNRLKAFAEDTAGKKEHKLPGWEEYKKIVGDSPASRSLFVDMQRRERWLLEASEQGPEQMATAFRARYQQLIQQRRQVMVINGATQIRSSQISTPSTAAMIFVVSHPRATADLHSLLSQLLNQSSVIKGLESGKEKEPLRKLLGSWIVHDGGNSQLAYQVLLLAMKHDIKEGVIRAERELAQPGLQGHVVQYAVMTVGKLGDESHVPVVTKRFSDRTICYTQRINNVTYQTQVRDVALACAIHLVGEDPKKFGFERIQQNALMLFQPGTVSFANEKDRQAAFDKWALFLKEREGDAKPGEEKPADDKPATDKPATDKPDDEKTDDEKTDDEKPATEKTPPLPEIKTPQPKE